MHSIRLNAEIEQMKLDIRGIEAERVQAQDQIYELETAIVQQHKEKFELD